MHSDFPGIQLILEQSDSLPQVGEGGGDQLLLGLLESMANRGCSLCESEDDEKHSHDLAEELARVYTTVCTWDAPPGSVDPDRMQTLILEAVQADLKEPRDEEWIRDAVILSRAIYEVRVISKIGDIVKKVGKKVGDWVKQTILRRKPEKPPVEPVEPGKPPTPAEEPSPEEKPEKEPPVEPVEPEEPEEEPEVEKEPATGVILYWRRTIVDSCPDCILLEKENPYTAETIPTYPLAGFTICRKHCHCYLQQVTVPFDRYKQVNEESLKKREKILDNLIGVQYQRGSFVRKFGLDFKKKRAGIAFREPPEFKVVDTKPPKPKEPPEKK